MLDPAFKAKWLADLRSGVYPKTKRHLKDGVGFCCLGVALCTLGLPFDDDPQIVPAQGRVERVFYPLPLESPVDIDIDDIDGEYGYNDDTRTDPRIVNYGNGLSYAGRKLVGLTFEEAGSLMTLNDDSDTFEPVIGFIENKL